MYRHVLLSLITITMISMQANQAYALDLWPFNNGEKTSTSKTSWWNKSHVKPTEIQSTSKKSGPSMFQQVSTGTKKTVSSIGSALNPKKYMPKSFSPSMPKMPKYLKPSYYYPSKKKSPAVPTGLKSSKKRESKSPWWSFGSQPKSDSSGLNSWVNQDRP